MNRFLAAMLYCLLIGNSIYAQDSTLILPKGEWLLKVNPLAVFEADGGIGFSMEFIIPKKRLGFQLEIQPLLFSVAPNGYKVDQPKGISDPGYPTGIKLRPELKYYFKGLRSTPYYQRHVTGFGGKLVRGEEPVRMYIATDFLYKNVWYNRISDFLIRNSGIQNSIRATYTDIKQVYGVDLKVGSVSQSFSNLHWWVEAFAGIGCRIKRFSYRNLPAGAAAPERFTDFYTYKNLFLSSRSTVFRISVPAGIKLIYNL